ncbi:MAG: Nramp family divalent metal transporter [Ignavibacteriae bacterium]|nr:Nramp family divalent metal transporter [Ignavibacteriota bacterium]
MKKTSFLDYLKFIGPGIAVAATGVGAGDLISASVAGAQYGAVILWAVILGAIFKYVLNEGIARWQLSTGSTILEGWVSRLPKIVSIYFITYLCIWSFVVAGALISACGIAANAIFPEFSIQVWGVIHSLFGAIVVYYGRYSVFEKLMKIFIAVMFVTFIYCAILVIPHTGLTLSNFIPSIPQGSGKFILSILGGVGGSVTLLSYGYWIRERGLRTKEDMNKSKFDLAVAYFFTGLFGIAVLIIATGITPKILQGSQIILEMSVILEALLGTMGKWIFLIGFWGAVFTSLLGVWQGVPYIFSDFIVTLNKHNEKKNENQKKQGEFYYNIFLIFLAVPPLLLLLFNRPGWIIIIYTITGSFFMPFLAITLLIMNNKKNLVGNFKNSIIINILLLICLLLFVYISADEIIDLF